MEGGVEEGLSYKLVDGQVVENLGGWGRKRKEERKKIEKRK